MKNVYEGRSRTGKGYIMKIEFKVSSKRIYEIQKIGIFVILIMGNPSKYMALIPVMLLCMFDIISLISMIFLSIIIALFMIIQTAIKCILGIMHYANKNGFTIIEKVKKTGRL